MSISGVITYSDQGLEIRKMFIDKQEVKIYKSLQVESYSPDGFNWGVECDNAGLQAALAIMLELCKSKDIAIALHLSFALKFLTNDLSRDCGFSLSCLVVEEWVKVKTEEIEDGERERKGSGQNIPQLKSSGGEGVHT